MKEIKENILKAKTIWLLAQEILSTHGYRVDSIDIIETDNEEIKIYHGNGHCFEIKKEYCCEPEEVEYFDYTDYEGYCYTFTEPWDDYTEVGEDKCIELLSEYAELPNQ